MKTIVLILLLVVVGCKSVQTTRSSAKMDDNINPVKMQNDTIRYLQTDIVGNKNKYIGQPLGKLLKSLKLEVKSYIPFFVYPKTEKLNGISLIFHSITEYNAFEGSATEARSLHIEFQSVLPSETALLLYKKNNIIWTTEVREYYSKQIVKDIVVPGMLLR